MSAHKGDRFLVVKRYPRDDVPRRLCDTLEQAHSVAVACGRSKRATKTDERLAGTTNLQELCSVGIYRIGPDGRVEEFWQSI